MVSPAISSSLKMHKFGSNLAQIIPPQNYLSIIGPPYFLLLKVYNNLGYSLFIFESIPVLKKNYGTSQSYRKKQLTYSKLNCSYKFFSLALTQITTQKLK